MNATAVLQYHSTLFFGGENLNDQTTVSLDTPLKPVLPHDQLLQKNARSSPSKRLSTTKKVTFSTHSPETALSTHRELTESDKKQIWYDENDLQAIRFRARSLAMRIHANRQKTDFEYSYARTMEEVFKQGYNLSEDEEVKLWAWFSKAHARRGLERLSCNHIGRNQRAKAAVRKVLQAQKELANIRIDTNTKADMLSHVSRGETGQATALAQVFGRADMVAATMDLDSML